MTLLDKLKQAQASRSQWRLLKQFPQLLSVAQADDLTTEQEEWLQLQQAIDEGFDACPSCKALGYGAYCQQCGTHRSHGTQPVHTCSKCHGQGVGPFCTFCGTQMVSEQLQALEDGSFDWAAWEQQMQKFTHPMTAKERALLEG